MSGTGWPPHVTDDDRRRFPGWSAWIEENAAAERRLVAEVAEAVEGARRHIEERVRRNEFSRQKRLARLRARLRDPASAR